MSEVKRYDLAEYNGGMDEIVDGTYVLADDFDRVTAERDAALGREAELRDECESRMRVITQVKLAREALQQRLSAAPEREDVLVGLLLEVASILQWDENGTPSVDLAVRIDAALKPADASDEHICAGCGTKGWTASCKECVPY